MGEHKTADMQLAMEELNELVKETDREEVVESANYVMERIKSELDMRPEYDANEVEKIKTQIYENFGRKGYLSRSIVCVTLLKQAYSSNNDPKFDISFSIIEEELKAKRNLLKESEGPKR